MANPSRPFRFPVDTEDDKAAPRGWIFITERRIIPRVYTPRRPLRPTRGKI